MRETTMTGYPGRITALLVAGLSLALAACEPKHLAADWPDDYRARHPIEVGPGKTVRVNRCGYWPESAVAETSNRSYYNFGCAYQRNLAAQVADPRDLARPRAMDPPYATRRETVLDKYDKGETTVTVDPYEDKGSVSEVGQ
jgi:pilus assembly protein CpaD